MPQKISLVTYSLRVREKGKKDNNLKLDSCGDIGDFYNFLSRFFDYLKNESGRDEASKKLIQLAKIDNNNEARTFCGLIKTGEWGCESDIVNSKEGKVKYHKQFDDAEMLPFYFFIYIPKEKDEGIIILQRFGIHGMTTAFKNSLSRYLNIEHEELIAEINMLVPEGLIDQYINKGEYTKLILKKFKLPTDLTDYYDDGDHKEIEGYAELRLVAYRNNYFHMKKNLKKFLSKEKDKLIEIKGFDYDDISIEVKLNQTTRKINLSDTSKLTPSYDVTSQIDIQPSGHPEYYSINEAAKMLFNDIKETLNPTKLK
jgi:hypothetical protein